MSADLYADASAALQVRALKDYCNNYDLTSLNIKAGDVITVIFTRPALNKFKIFETVDLNSLFYSHVLLKFQTVLTMQTFLKIHIVSILVHIRNSTLILCNHSG